MGGLVQQINLYRGHDAKNSANSSVRLLLISGVGALCLVLVLAIAGEIYMSGVAADRALVAENLRHREAELAKFSAKFTVPAIDPHLEAELVRLRAVRDGLNTNLMLIARQTGTRSEGFSAYFGGLARNTLDGLWFNNVAVSAGGEEMLLKGRTLEPELVPRLLQTLAGEQAFAGRSFRKVTFERQELESGALIDFELRSAQSEEIDDAG
jgi:hypothetical protein